MGSEEGIVLQPISGDTAASVRASAANKPHRGRKPLPPRPEGSDGAVLRLVGWGFLVLGVLNTFLSLAGIVAGEYTVGTLILIWLFFGALPLVGAALLFPLARKKKEALQAELDQWLESCVLQLAARHNGQLTVPKVAQELEMGLDESTGVLDRLAKRQVADLVVTDSGGLVYQFPDDSKS